jgi:feruloyl esterase
VKGKSKTGLWAGLLFGTNCCVAIAAAAAPTCSVQGIQALAPPGAAIDKAEATALPVPHCKVDGHIITTNPGPDRINFRLQLPDEGWTGRYFFIGMGGSAGYVPTDSQVPAGNPLLKGFAVAGTDTGHQGPMLDWTFLNESKAKVVDHRDRGAHVTAVATQQITKKYYAADKLYRYMTGCSGGGRMSTEAITRHPEDFDGVVLGAPGQPATILAFINAAQQMNREPGSWLSPAKLQFAEKKVTEQCDALDGAKDGIIWDHTACKVDFNQWKCAAGGGPECLTEPEIKSINSILAGPRSPKGQVKVGWPISNMSVWSGFLGPVPPPWSPDPTMTNMPKSSGAYVIATTMASVYLHPGFDVLKDFDFNNQKNVDDWYAGSEKVQFGIPFSTDLRGYKKAGGKLIMWNGVSDPCCSDVDQLTYFQSAGKKVGGMQQLDEFAKFYSIPGMAHCGGGTGPQDAPDQLIEAMIAWVEKDRAPGPVVAHRGDRAKMLFADPKTGTVSGVLVPPSKGTARDFLLCPYPQVAKFNQALANTPGAVDDAANWSCKAQAAMTAAR